MKYIVAILSGIFMFFSVGFLLTFIMLMTFPHKWFGISLNLGLLSANLPSIIVLVISSIAATHTLRASVNAKSFRLYRKKKIKIDQTKIGRGKE